MAYNENRPLQPPKDKTLPFFAYGIFKPGQLAYPRIKNLVKTYCEHEIDYEMSMRDGVPLITQQRKYSRTVGYLIYFTEEHAEDAYEIISETHYEKLYRWEEIIVDDNPANVLMGVNPKMGSSGIEGSTGNYDGQNDPYFKEAIEVVENELNDEDKHWSNINDFLRLQMSYLLLWTAIERYISLKYNCPEIWQKWKILSKEKVFKMSLKRHVESTRTVYSAKDLREFTLDPKNPYYSVNYYYTIRCNVAHRGKALHSDDYIIRQSLKELLAIFKDIINATFDER